MNTRWINCEVCQTEGRILCSNGGPDDIDMGECPECHGQRVVEVETHPITLQTFEQTIADYIFTETTKLDAPISYGACLVMAKHIAALAPNHPPEGE